MITTFTTLVETGGAGVKTGTASIRPAALEGPLGQVYGEEAFRYFLEIERQRAARLAGCSFLLLLVGLKRYQTEPHLWISEDLATTVFSTMWRCLRETDVVGWYREDRVAGAVLTQLTDGTQADVSLLIRQRVSGSLCETLAPDVVRRLQMRFIPVRSRGSRYENRNILDKSS